VAQEKLIRSSDVPFTIVRATQFFEFLGAIGDSGMANGAIHLPAARMQPIAADDVAAALADIAVEPPINGILEVAGPEAVPMYEAVRRYLSAKGDSREVVSAAEARYYGARVDDSSLTPGGRPRVGPTSLEQWLSSAN
jgi:uncharacterized protein YbjT (DUF2867 family)